ncbi:hypothetical protein B0H16DRAFT_1517498, partial [Mycena metata]
MTSCISPVFPSFVVHTLRPPSTMALSPYSNRDSNALRASVYDVFLELGALDFNSRVADWIFTDPDLVLPDPDVLARRRTREAVRFKHEPEKDVERELVVEAAATSQRRRPASSSRTFGLNFSPKRSRPRSSQSKSVSPATTSPASSPTNDGYDSDEGYGSASQGSSPKYKGRVRAAFSLQSTTRSPTPTSAAEASPSTKPLPSLPPIRERLTRTVSSSSVAKAKSLFRKRSKYPAGGGSDDELQEWHDFPALTPRVFNPSVENGAALAPAPAPPPSSFRQIPPTSFLRQIIATPVAAADPHADNNSGNGSGDNSGDNSVADNLTFTLPRTFFRTISLTKRRVSRPPSLTLVDDDYGSPRQATSLPSSPFILLAEGGAASAGPNTPFVFVSGIDNPTPNSARTRRFSEVTSMTAPFGMGLYPVSISKTLRRSMVFDKLEPSFPRLRPSSSYGSLQDALAMAASVTSPYDIYNQPIPGIQRGKESPFPARPVLPQPLSSSLVESRIATIQRYREFSEQLVELTPYKRFVQMREG